MCCSSTSKILAIMMPIFVVFIVFSATSSRRVSPREDVERKSRSDRGVVAYTAASKEEIANKIDLAEAERNALAKGISFAASLKQLAEMKIAEKLEQSRIRAEIRDSNEAEALATSNDEEAATGTDSAKQALSEDAWYDAPPQVDGDVHYVAVPCDVSGSLDESLRTVGESIVREAHRYVEQFVLDDVAIHFPENLTEEWIRERWLVPGKVYDKVHIMPSGEYHQAIVQIRIPPKDRKMIRDWSLDRTRNDRAAQVGFMAAGAVGLLGVAHLILGLFAGRRRPNPEVNA